AYEYQIFGKSKNIQFLILKTSEKNNNINQPTPQSEWKTSVPSEVDPLIQKLSVPEVRLKLQEKNLYFTRNKLYSYLVSDNNFLLLNNMNLKNLLDEKLEPVFALKTGNIEKRKKYSLEDMLKELQRL
ncbi:11079_t:CDS:2, partial [Entrophospora sp. SA101]